MRIEIRTHGVSLTPDQEAVLERRLRFALGRFAGHIGRVRVWVADENGPRGGVDHRSLLEVELRQGPKVHAEAQGVDVEIAVASGARRAARRVRDELARRRLFDRRPRAVQITEPVDAREEVVR